MLVQTHDAVTSELPSQSRVLLVGQKHVITVKPVMTKQGTGTVRQVQYFRAVCSCGEYTSKTLRERSLAQKLGEGPVKRALRYRA
jgi:hypothetical protein